MPTIVSALLVLLLPLSALADTPEVAYAVDFTKGLQGWRPNATARVTEAKDGIVVTTNGVDPILVSPEIDIEPRAGDVLEVRIAASRIGDIQWFWRTDRSGPYGGFSGDKSRTATTMAGDGFHTVTARAFWSTAKHVVGLRFDLPEGGPGVYRIASLRVLRGPDTLPTVWRREYRLPISPKRIDVAKEKPPATKAVASDYTVAMWYFAAWEPEYTWDGWQQIAERAPWRMPLLYDSSDPAMEYSGIRYYRSSNRTAIDWHVHWMRENAVNLMIWDWYPQRKSDGSFDPTFFGNRALECGFLGKETLGGPPVATNRFAETMPFAIMWTNHAPSNGIGKGLIEYIVDQFLLQPNYYRIDGKPFLSLWSVSDLVAGAGGKQKARAVLDELRAYAAKRGLPGVYIAAVNGVGAREELTELGIDGAMGYNILLSGGSSSEYRKVGDRVLEDRIEDFDTQTVPGHEATWKRMAGIFGREYLVPTCPMQNWEPTLRPTNYVIRNHTPDGYREMLRRARAFIEKRGLRRFVTVEAFNEWLEGSYVEPSTQWGASYLEAIRDVFGKKP
jgi:hypothetical protein